MIDAGSGTDEHDRSERVASNDNNGPDDEAVEGSWSPRRSKAGSTRKPSSKAAKGDSGTPDQDVLVDEIEKTREELAETLDAIADKVSPKRVTARTKKKVGDAVQSGTSDAVEAAKDTAHAAAEAVKGGVAAVKDKVGGDDPERAVPMAVAEVPVEPAPTPGALADAAYTPVTPPGAETPVYTSTLPPPPPSRMPAVIGAGAAVLVALLVMRRRRR